jgi:hypothetical protein
LTINGDMMTCSSAPNCPAPSTKQPTTLAPTTMNPTIAPITLIPTLAPSFSPTHRPLLASNGGFHQYNAVMLSIMMVLCR